MPFMTTVPMSQRAQRATAGKRPKRYRSESPGPEEDPHNGSSDYSYSPSRSTERELDSDPESLQHDSDRDSGGSDSDADDNLGDECDGSGSDADGEEDPITNTDRARRSSGKQRGPKGGRNRREKGKLAWACQEPIARACVSSSVSHAPLVIPLFHSLFPPVLGPRGDADGVSNAFKLCAQVVEMKGLGQRGSGMGAVDGMPAVLLSEDFQLGADSNATMATVQRLVKGSKDVMAASQAKAEDPLQFLRPRMGDAPLVACTPDLLHEYLEMQMLRPAAGRMVTVYVRRVLPGKRAVCRLVGRQPISISRD
jgi:hypothetical protein